MVPLLVVTVVSTINADVPIRVYTLDVGITDLLGTFRIEGPQDRMSTPRAEDAVTYRDFLDRLVYFSLTDRLLEEAESLAIVLRYRSSVPENGAVFLAVRDERATYSFAASPVDSGVHERLANLPRVVDDGTRAVIATGSHPDRTYGSVQEFLDQPPPYSRVAVSPPYKARLDLTPTDKSGLRLPDFTVEQYAVDHVPAGHTEGGVTVVDSPIRGGGVFFTYVEGSELELEIEKQDLNWYPDREILTVQVFSVTGEVVGGFTLEDDGEVLDTRVRGLPQIGSLRIPGLEPGIYKIRISAAHDLLISRLEVNQQWLVAQGTLFLAGSNSLYTKAPVLPTALYVGASYEGRLGMMTPHEAGLQTAIVTDGEFLAQVTLAEVARKDSLALPAGAYAVILPRQDVVLETNMYVAFTPESYFEPIRVLHVPFNLNYEHLVTQADYIVLNVPQADDGWKLVRVVWTREDFVLIRDSFTFALSIAGAVKDGQQTFTVQVDWVRVEARIPPLWKR